MLFMFLMEKKQQMDFVKANSVTNVTHQIRGGLSLFKKK